MAIRTDCLDHCFLSTIRALVPRGADLSIVPCSQIRARTRLGTFFSRACNTCKLAIHRASHFPVARKMPVSIPGILQPRKPSVCLDADRIPALRVAPFSMQRQDPKPAPGAKVGQGGESQPCSQGQEFENFASSNWLSFPDWHSCIEHLTGNTFTTTCPPSSLLLSSLISFWTTG